MDSEGWITESYFSLIPEDGLLMTLSQADERMSEPALHNFFVMVCKLRDRADGDVVGVATELEERHPDPATEGMITRTEWSIFLPGKGTLHFDEIEDQSGVQRHVLNPAGRSGQTWTGRWEVITTVGPGLDGKGVIEGGTRAFHGAHGTAEEINTITRWDPTVGAIDVLIELRLRYRTTPEADSFQLPEAQTISGSHVAAS